jgi:hypothetical protein
VVTKTIAILTIREAVAGLYDLDAEKAADDDLDRLRNLTNHRRGTGPTTSGCRRSESHWRSRRPGPSVLARRTSVARGHPVATET